MKLVIASNNKHKIEEIKAILCNKFEPIISMREAGINHETVEDGETFMDNARKKAREICDICGVATLADDSGICVDALGGAPGVFSARYASQDGENADDEANNDLLLKNLEGVINRSAHYTAAMVIAYPDGSEISAEGYMHGEIIDRRIGSGGFGYDPMFRPEGENRTVAEMTAEEKNKISHRSKALSLLLEKV